MTLKKEKAGTSVAGLWAQPLPLALDRDAVSVTKL